MPVAQNENFRVGSNNDVPSVGTVLFQFIACNWLILCCTGAVLPLAQRALDVTDRCAPLYLFLVNQPISYILIASESNRERGGEGNFRTRRSTKHNAYRLQFGSSLPHCHSKHSHTVKGHRLNASGNCRRGWHLAPEGPER